MRAVQDHCPTHGLRLGRQDDFKHPPVPCATSRRPLPPPAAAAALARYHRPPMARRLFTLLSALSLLLCGAVVVLWVRSYSVADRFQRQNKSGRVQLISSYGTLSVAYWDGPFADAHGWIHWGQEPEWMSPSATAAYSDTIEVQANPTEVWRGRISGVTVPA